MTQQALESPRSAEELYLAAADEEVEPARPFMTGDVFRDVDIPGTEGTGPGIILTHPCSMRVDGVRLAERLLVARVTACAEIPLKKWSSGFFKVMPLPGLTGNHYSAHFGKIGLIKSVLLTSVRRIACLTPYGINLSQQRFVWYLTRFLAPTHRLNEATSAVFEEVDLCEAWVAATVEAGMDRDEAANAFHEWIRDNDESSARRQDLLAEPQRRACIRRQMRLHLKAEYS